MLTGSAQMTNPDVPGIAQNPTPSDIGDLSFPEIYSLYEVDATLPERIRENLKAVQAAKSRLFEQSAEGWNKKTEALFIEFDRAVLLHLKTVSVEMYLPVRKRLRAERAASFERFKVFESRAAKTNELVAVFLRKYYKSNQFFNTAFVQDVKTDMDRVVSILVEQLGRERAYLFPLYQAEN